MNGAPERRTKTVTLWCTTDEVEWIDRVAARRGYKRRADFVRDALKRGVDIINRSGNTSDYRKVLAGDNQ